MNDFFSLNNILPDYYDTITKWIELVGINSGFYKYCGSTIIDNLICNIKPKTNNNTNIVSWIIIPNIY